MHHSSILFVVDWRAWLVLYTFASAKLFHFLADRPVEIKQKVKELVHFRTGESNKKSRKEINRKRFLKQKWMNVRAKQSYEKFDSNSVQVNKNEKGIQTQEEETKS